MNANKLIGHGCLGLAALLLVAQGVHAQSVAGLWGSSLYRVQLSVSGSQVTGSFAPTETANAPSGTLSGQLKADGKSFTAKWTFPAGTDTASFGTWLQFAANGRLLNGYRWSDETQPTAFALHRAVSGQVPVLPDQDSVSGTGPSGTTPPVTTTTLPPKPPTTATTAPTTTPGLEVIICESVAEGQPHNVRSDFTTPKSIVAYLRYTNLPANSAVDWVWTLDGKPEARLSKALGGTGWHCHGLQSQTAIIPGSYQVTVSIKGRAIATRTVIVRGPAAAPPSSPTPPATTTPGAQVTVCESVVDGQPQNRGTQFTRPKSLSCLVNYAKLPQDSEIKWVWTRGGAEIARNVKSVSGTGWCWHGLTSTSALSPGAYEVAVYVRRSLVSRVAITVR